MKTKSEAASKKSGSKAVVPAKPALAKVPAKAVPKSVAKPVTKAAKPAAPVAAPKASPAKAAVAKKAPSAKPIAKSSTTAVPAKPATKPTLASAKAPSVATKAAAKPAATIAPASSPAPKAAAKAVAAPKVAAPVVAAAAPAKAPRPSSRLAQVTVPSMAQSVASNAPKASFTPFKESPVIAPASTASIKKDPKLANNWKSKPAEQLTDAELMAMPDAEYMNEIQLAAFRYRLVELKQGILNNAGETTEHLREDTSIVPDPADRATIEEEHALELRTRDRERKLLKKIEMSIARIDAGDYGYCDETGEPIGVGRLLARPTATLSLEAQQRRELKQKMYGD